MSSKKHSTRNNDPSSSSSESDSSTSSNSTRNVKKKSKRHNSEDNYDTESKKNKTKHQDMEKEKRRASEDRSKGSFRHEDERYRKKSRSRSPERKSNYDERSRSRDGSRREKGSGRNYEEHRPGGSNVKYERDDRRKESRDDRYDSKDRREDRQKDNYYDNRRNQRRDYDDRRPDWKNDRRRRSRSKSFDHASAKWGKGGDQKNFKDEKKEAPDKQKPNFGLSGKLTEETNSFRGVVIKYSEPPEARKPRRRWRLYPFKGEKALQTLYIHRESAYLIGRERKVVDLAVDHPSCSKQHAALQYRLVPFTRDDGSVGKRVRPYLIDLDSANGTFINNKKIDPRKYVELLEKDVVKFGFSSREYVLLHENSKDEAMDDDVKVEEEVDIKEEPN